MAKKCHQQQRTSEAIEELINPKKKKHKMNSILLMPMIESRLLGN